MLEILYDTDTKRVRGWCADPDEFGNFEPKPNQEVVIWDIPIPPHSDWYEVDLANEVIVSNPDYKPRPQLCTHWARIESLDPARTRPVVVTRTWGEYEYTFDCFVTEGVKDQFLSGDILVGDFVLVEFLDNRADRAIVFAKVLKTW